MPIRRRADGEVVEEATRPQRAPSQRRAADRDTKPLKAEGAADEDSLFEPRKAGIGSGDRLEAPTVPLDDSGRVGEVRTRIIRPRRGDDQADAPAAAKGDDPMRDPPVGWLVVVRGPGKGRVLTLGNGMNVIGRGAACRVRMDFGDDSISRTNHARVAYEPRQRRFLLSHGDGSNLTYVNREVVMGSLEIESGAMIEVGETTLRFQALCSREFDWADIDA